MILWFENDSCDLIVIEGDCGARFAAPEGAVYAGTGVGSAVG